MIAAGTFVATTAEESLHRGRQAWIIPGAATSREELGLHQDIRGCIEIVLGLFGLLFLFCHWFRQVTLRQAPEEVARAMKHEGMGRMVMKMDSTSDCLTTLVLSWENSQHVIRL
ncbi:hypothetical protein MLD38_040354 [Melastoma candidum]|uniref:Uncharacterized protein n=1 Tax=Melastoma candidum TaxID=119954 RepID=A0ACB9L6I4_9MYRT|nr:hypothetical protein MLD38_040354 [Melastoma candidum]